MAHEPTPDPGAGAPLLYGPWSEAAEPEITVFDRGSLRVLFDREHASLFRFLCRLTANAADAEDLLQETFLVVWRKRDQFAGKGSAAGYLRKTAFRVFLNSKQKSQRRAGLFQPKDREPKSAPPADAELEEAEAREFLATRVREALAELKPEMREAFVLFRFEGLTAAQIAESLEVPVKTVESRVRRATLILAEKLKAHRDEVPLIK